MRLDTTAEEWFRVELLTVLAEIPVVKITSTNERMGETRDRPDFALSVDGVERLIELKVLPRDRNYPYGWQRFQSGKNNKNDFLRLSSGTRHGIIYVYWPDAEDWISTKIHLAQAYQLDCIREDVLTCQSSEVVFSY